MAEHPLADICCPPGIQERVIRRVALYLAWDLAKVTPDMPLRDGFFDSMDMIELGIDLEEHFDIELTDEVLQSVKTVADLVEAVTRAGGFEV